METTVTAKQVLKYLQASGWSVLIDKRWERKVIKDIVLTFPDVTLETLDEVLDIVLVE